MVLTSKVSRLFLQARSEALFDCVNQSVFALRSQTLGEWIVLNYKFYPWKFYKRQ